jgi:hypothetical protein
MRGLLLATLLLPTEGVGQDAGVDYARDVQPILKTHCWSCHGASKQKGGLRLDGKAAAFRGGLSGPAIVPGKGRGSRLVELLRLADPEERMPLNAAPLSPAQIDLLRAWIDQGAAWPEAATAPHWAYVKPVRRGPPAPARNPVDAFLEVERHARGLRPRPEANPSTLLRRVYLDLIGLPPTREELRAYLAAPDYEAVVDRLLADPRFGERWGRHWMDVWRYSDMSEFEGNEILSSQRHLWRWRDWIVESLNADKGYDRMLTEMLAGDEVAPDDPRTLRATGFLARNYYKLNRNVWLDNAVEHTSKAFLATTVNCARCHNHFFDPVSQEDYYRFRALFEPYDVRIDPVPGESDPVRDGLPRVYDAHADVPTYLFVRGEEQKADTTTPLPPGLPQALGGGPIRIRSIPLPPQTLVPQKQDFVRRDLVAAAERRIAQAREQIDVLLARTETPEAKPRQQALEELPAAVRAIPLAEARLASLRATLDAERIEDAGDTSSENFLRAAREALAAQRRLALLEGREARSTARRTGKNPAEAEQAVAKAEAMTEFVRREIKRYPSTSTGRRTALAAWIADPGNPLTARVAVNHVWMRHFGRALVPSVFDFGTQGRRPSHPALLDWLAVEFTEKGWSLKTLHRLLVTSAAYRMDSTPDAAALAVDPENTFLWRMNARRLEAEAVRDAVLYVAGRLDPAVGGPELDAGQGLVSRRRSLYFRHTPEKRMEFLAVFDGPSATECYARTPTIVPQQALALLNSALAFDSAAAIGRRLQDPDVVAAAFETVLARPPSPPERDACVRFLAEGGPGRRETLIHMLLNHHEFVTIR